MLETAEKFLDLNSAYKLEAASSAKDFLLMFKLRRAVESTALKALSTTDRYDLNARHVIIRNKKTQAIVGGFRMTQMTNSTVFSCESVFNIDRIKAKSLRILEVSRLFLLPEHKHGNLLLQIANFIHEHCCTTDSEIIICNQSLNSGASRNAALIARYFKLNGLMTNDLFCPVDSSFEVPNFQNWYNHFTECLSENEIQECSSLLSTSFQKCLDLGATVSGVPALERASNRIDFLTILHKDDLNKSLWKNSFSHSELLAKSSFS